MKSSRSSLDKIVLLALAAYFLSRVAMAGLKLFHGELGTSLKMVSDEHASFPSVTVCLRMNMAFEQLLRPKTTFVRGKSEVPRLAFKFQSSYFDEKGDLIRVDLNRSGLATYAHINAFSVAKIGGESEPGTVLDCLTIDPPGPSPVSQTQKVWLNVTRRTRIEMWVHNRGQLLPPSTQAMYGAAFKVIRVGDKHRRSYFRQKFRLGKDRWVTLDNPRERCKRGQSSDLTKCVTRYVERHTQCRGLLPESNRSLADCRTPEESRRFHGLVYALRRLNENQVYERTGCMASCQKDVFRVSDHTGIIEKSWPGTGSVFQLGLFNRDTRYMLLKQYVIYDFNSFIADVGGYLGLMLGHSILSAYHGLMGK